MGRTLELYRPSNGTEGMCFEAEFCDRCVHDSEDKCEIHDRALLFDTDDKEYPHEWWYDGEGNPTCTAFATEIAPPTRGELEEAGQLRLTDA